jgi:predicted dehydrogenase
MATACWATPMSSADRSVERPLRVGIIGLGAMGHHHAQACRAETNVELVAGCDIAAEKRAAWGAAFVIAEDSLYPDHEAMLEREQLDLVIVATHATAHHAPVLAAAQRGVHVFCEKPPAMTLREADEMVTACEKAGVKLAVNHIKRGSRGNAIAQKLIADGAIGTPYLIRGEAKGARWAGSELMEMGTHLFDWLRHFAGDAQWLFAHLVHDGRAAERSDIVHSLELPYKERDCGLVLGQRAFCSLGFPSGLHADVGFLFQPNGRDVGYGFDICGTEGTLAVRRSVATDIFLQRGPHRGPLAAAEWEQIPVDEAEDAPSATGTPAGKPAERLACQRRMLRDLAAAIVEDREPYSSGRDGRAALELVMAVWQSHRLGQPVSLPLSEREHPLEQWVAETPPGE